MNGTLSPPQVVADPTTSARPRHRRLRIGLAVSLVVILGVVVAFDWNWLRGPLNHYVSQKTRRTFTSSHLDVRLGAVPTIRLRDVVFANAPWTSTGPMAKIPLLEFSVSLRDLFEGKVLIPRAALTDAELRFERLPDGRKNWVLSDPNDTSPSRLRISSLSITRGNLQYLDRGMPFDLRVAASTFEPAARAKASNADAAPHNASYTTKYVFGGHYHDASFSGQALTGDVLSFQESGINFPIRAELAAGTTKLAVEGTAADAAHLSAIDVRLKMSGQTLANIYPFLLLPLPASPPYSIEGHLTQKGTRYGLDDIRGQIGSTDVSGSGAYVQGRDRPMLQARLHSKLLDFADLGPLVGLTTKASRDASPPTQAQTNTRTGARAQVQQAGGERVLPAGTPSGERLLPTGKFEGGRFRAIDADAELTAQRVKAPDRLEVANVKAVLHLKDAVLTLDPFDLDFGGGRILSNIRLDARQSILSSRTDVRLQRIRLSELLPANKSLTQSGGWLDGHLSLQGTGDSVADAAAKASGRIGVVLSEGHVSNLLDALAGLNGGKVIALLIGGDKAIELRCGATAFDVHDGQGRSQLFVVDTAQTRIDGSGSFDLDHERFDAMLAPKPKRRGILSLRTPLHLYGSFRHPDYELDKGKLALRAGGAVALAAIAPMAALIPLIETGPGSDVDCRRLSDVALASTSSRAAAAPAHKSK